MLTPVSTAADLQEEEEEEEEEEFYKCGRTLPQLVCLGHPSEGCTAAVGTALQRRLLLLKCMQRLHYMQSLKTAKLLLTPGHSM